MINNKKNNWFLKMIDDLINPISPLVLLVIGGFLSILLTDYFKGENKIIQVKYICLFWIVMLLIYIIFNFILRSKDQELDRLIFDLNRKNAIIEEKDIQIRNNISLIEGKYGEFSEYIKLSKYENICMKIVNKYRYVEGIQIHDYVVTPKRSVLQFKIQYYTGYAKEGSTVNSIQQKYYELDNSIYSEFRNVIKYYNNSFDKNDSKDIDNLYEKCMTLFKKTLNLNCQGGCFSSELSIIINLLLEIVFEIKPDANKQDNVSMLEVKHRCGIFSSIVRSSDTVYTYNKSNDNKDGRLYFTFLDILDNENKAVTLILNQKAMIDKEKEVLIQDVISYYEEFLKNKL